MAKKLTMIDRIWRHLLEYGSITTWEAFMEYGCTRLSEYIRQLRQDYEIQDVWLHRKNRYKETVRFKKYFLAPDWNEH